MQAVITSVQRFSLNDGPGIRTTVFFKGCNMACAWCHNPETLSSREDLHFYESKCIGCGKCMAVCPRRLHSVGSDGEHLIDRADCTRCGACAEACYAQALVMSGNRVTVEDLMKEILMDKHYYINSGGGVTLSGGETFCQRAFAVALTDACRDNGISVGIETNLNFPFEEMRPLLERTELLMADIKLMDEDLHIKYTGCGNGVTLENIRKADELGIPMIIRTPIVPGITDTIENLRRTAEFVKQIKNLMYYELLNFNPLGSSKYKSLGLRYAFEHSRPLPPDKLNEISDLLSPYGIALRFA